IYNNLALLHRNNENYDSARFFFNKSLDIRKATGNKRVLASTYNNIGSMYRKMNLYDKALNNYLEALTIRIEIDDRNGIASSYNNIGTLYQNINNYEKALEYYKKALQLIEEKGNNKEIAYTLHIIGNSYLHLENYDKALENYQQSLILRKKIGDEYYIAQSLHNIGLVYEKMDDYERALNNFNRALKYRQNIGDATGICSLLNDKGNFYLNRKMPDKAKETFLKAIEIARENNELYYLSLCTRKLGNIFLKENKTNKAITNLNYSLDAGYEINNKELIKNAFLDLYKLFRKQNDHKKALEYYIQYSNYQDTIRAQKNNLKIIETQMNYELAQKEDQLNEYEDKVSQLSMEKKIKDLKLDRQRNIQILLFVSFFLVIIVGVLFYKRYRLKKKTNLLLQKQYNEIKEANDKLRKSESELRKANATKDRFFSIIAHDLRSPFHALYGLTDHISVSFNKLSNRDLKEFIDLIHKSADQLLNLLENLLYWSRTQRGKIDFNPKPLDLEKIVNSTKELLQINANEKNIYLTTKCNHHSIVYGDEEMLTTTIRNLTSNAIKFTVEGGSVTIKTNENENEILVSVKDTGLGISEENQQKLFKIDQNYSTYGTQQERGTGLGLILCKEFVEKHGGKIWVESEINKGSTFTFNLPKKNRKIN
ncbi:MAG: tetratricopeptide repeat protein, partial [Bacteroidota bacterium]